MKRSRVDAISQAREWGLNEKLIHKLEDMKVTSFFPVQEQAIPGILHGPPNVDVCVSAPTGSGKTMTYVLPIVHLLEGRIIPRIRALVVVPSRDLAIQVKGVFDTYCASTNLKTALLIGQSKFSNEQEEVVGVCSNVSSSGVNVYGKDRDMMEVARNVSGGYSIVDIIVATPGRLIDHLRQTPGFTLQHLEFLVVDEADRLLTQSYHGWIEKIYQSVYSSSSSSKSFDTSCSSSLDPETIRLRPREMDVAIEPTMKIPFRQFLFSATLTRNPKKLAALELRNPKIYAIGRDPTTTTTTTTTTNETMLLNPNGKQMYSTPENLQEFMLECSIQEKPLLLLQLLQQWKGKQMVIFTASVDATHRLCRLLQLYGNQDGSIREYSSSLSQKQRSKLLSDCRIGDVTVLVSSDAMARGMDIQNVEIVVNYDVPVFIKTYIHRIGRTARGGKVGTCITLIKSDQIKGFRNMLKKANNSFVRQYAIDREAMKSLVPRYATCLGVLRSILEQERNGMIDPSTPLDPYHGDDNDLKVSTSQGNHSI